MVMLQIAKKILFSRWISFFKGFCAFAQYHVSHWCHINPNDLHNMYLHTGYMPICNVCTDLITYHLRWPWSGGPIFGWTRALLLGLSTCVLTTLTQSTTYGPPSSAENTPVPWAWMLWLAAIPLRWALIEVSIKRTVLDIHAHICAVKIHLHNELTWYITWSCSVDFLCTCTWA